MPVDHLPGVVETRHNLRQRVRLPYMPGLDGLRALALIAVFLYHADLKWIPGGFLGVEVFFVLSGYLITALLLAEWQFHRRFDLEAFWLRRARRLLPALLVLVGGVLSFAILVLPAEARALGSEAAAAATYMSNWYLVLVRRSYFQTMGRPSLLRHLWSLAIEGQLYLLWPPLLLIGLRCLKPPAICRLLLLTAAASALWMAAVYDPNTDPSRVYFGTDTRAAGFFIGAALALFWSPGRRAANMGRAAPWLLDGAGAAALAGLGAAFCWLDEFQPFVYRGGLVAVAVTTAIAIAAAVSPRTRLCPYLLSRPFLRWLGSRSYSIYLWHWPVFMVTRPQIDLPFDGLPLLALRSLLSLALAECSYRLVETPMRSGRLQRAREGQYHTLAGRHSWLDAEWVGFLFALVLVCIGLGESIATATPLKLPADDQLAALPTPIPTQTASPTPPQPGTNAWGEALRVRPMRFVLTGFIPTATPVVQTTRARPTDTPASQQTPAVSGSARDPFALPPEEIRWFRSPAAHRKPPKPTPATVTILGDSVMLGAIRTLQQALPQADIDAAVGRQGVEALQVLRARRDAGQLGDIVVIHLGSNGLFRVEQLDEIVGIATRNKHVILINIRVPRRWQDPVNEMLSDGMRRYPNVTVIDWYAASADRPELFGEDGVHLTAEGAQVYTALIVAALSSQGIAFATSPSSP